MVKTKNKPPSRVRYEESHPVIAVRVDEDTDAALRDLSKKTGKSLGALIKENLEVQKRDEGKAYESAKSEYQILIPCAKCGKPMVLSPGSKMHQATIKSLAGWSHAKC
jgi:hypothetical protein